MDDPWATIEALADDETLGAAETAERAARALAEIPAGRLADPIETLLRGHPQMAPLWRLASDVLSARDSALGTQQFSDRLKNDEDAVPVLAPILPDRILTISYSSTVKEVIRMRQPRILLCMASEPGGEGLQMMGAVSAYAETAVIDDEEAIDRLPADAVVIGADAITPTSLVNKLKTRQLAEAAKAKHIPCLAVTGETKFVPEELPVEEPFELTSLDLFSGIATPMGLLTPSEASTYAADVELHEALRMLIPRLSEEPEEPAS